MDEGARVLQQQLEYLVAEGFVLPLSIVMIDCRGHVYCGVFSLQATGEGAFITTVDTIGEDLIVLPYYYLVVDHVGQAAAIHVTYRGETSEMDAEGSPMMRLHTQLHILT